MNFKRVLTMLLALCLILNMAVPGVSALTAGENEYVPGQNPTASEKAAKGEPVRVTTLRDAVQAQPKTQGNWSAEQVAVPEADLMGKAQLPQGVKELRAEPPARSSTAPRRQPSSMRRLRPPNSSVRRERIPCDGQGPKTISLTAKFGSFVPASAKPYLQPNASTTEPTNSSANGPNGLPSQILPRGRRFRRLCSTTTNGASFARRPRTAISIARGLPARIVRWRMPRTTLKMTERGGGLRSRPAFAKMGPNRRLPESSSNRPVSAPPPTRKSDRPVLFLGESILTSAVPLPRTNFGAIGLPPRNCPSIRRLPPSSLM